MLSKVLLLAVPVQVATSDTFPTECYGVPDNTACSQYHQLGVENVAYVCSQVEEMQVQCPAMCGLCYTFPTECDGVADNTACSQYHSSPEQLSLNLSLSATVENVAWLCSQNVQDVQVQCPAMCGLCPFTFPTECNGVPDNTTCSSYQFQDAAQHANYCNAGGLGVQCPAMCGLCPFTFPTECNGVPDNTTCSFYHFQNAAQHANYCNAVEELRVECPAMCGLCPYTFPTECYGVADNATCSNYHLFGVDVVANLCSSVEELQVECPAMCGLCAPTPPPTSSKKGVRGKGPTKGKGGPTKGKGGPTKGKGGPSQGKGTKKGKGTGKGNSATLMKRATAATARTHVGAGAALVGMLGFVALVAAKLRSSVAAEEEDALLAEAYAVPHNAAV